MSIPPLRTTPKSLSPTAQRILHSLNTCTSPSQLLQIHAQILLHNLHPNTTIASSFIDTCRSLGHLYPAFALFSSLRRPHVFVCNTLIRASLFLPSSSPPPLLIYSHMLQSSVAPNNYTFPLLLKSLSDVRQGRMLHSQAVRTGLSADIYVQNSLLNFYSSCMDVTTCEQLFDEIPVKDVVAWTTMIMKYRNCGRPDEALIAFERMQFAGVQPNRVTMVNALTACASHGALEMGVWIHDYIRRSGWELDVILGTSLVDMYGKCGRVDAGVSVFSSMLERNVYTWNSLIGGFSFAKSGEEALRWFFKMEHEGVKPNAVTMIAVLSACSHAGLVEMGQRIFNWVVSGRYGFYPGVKHYGCMVDLLGRAGFLHAAVEFIERMPFKPNMVIWGSLLRGCRAHGDLRLSELAVKMLVELEPANVAHYVLLSNLYAERGRWRDAEEVRRLMKERGLWRDAEEVRRLMKERGLRKDAGWSFMEGRDLVQECVG